MNIETLNVTSLGLNVVIANLGIYFVSQRTSWIVKLRMSFFLVIKHEYKPMNIKLLNVTSLGLFYKIHHQTNKKYYLKKDVGLYFVSPIEYKKA